MHVLMRGNDNFNYQHLMNGCLTYNLLVHDKSTHKIPLQNNDASSLYIPTLQVHNVLSIRSIIAFSSYN